MKLGILYSSGKDSTFTTHYFLSQSWDVCCLLTILPDNPDSFMFQNPLRKLVELQAKAMGLPVLFQRTKGEEEKELQELKQLLKKGKKEFGIEGVGVGALASDYQFVRVQHVCHELGLKAYAPLWHKEQLSLLRDFVSSGYDIRMTRIAAHGLDASWLGKKLGHDDLAKLEKLHEKLGLHPSGEGGEFETIVLDAPFFSQPLMIAYEQRMESQDRGELMIKHISVGQDLQPC